MVPVPVPTVPWVKTHMGYPYLCHSLTQSGDLITVDQLCQDSGKDCGWDIWGDGELECDQVQIADSLKLKQMTLTAGQKKFNITKLVQKQVDSKWKAKTNNQLQVILNKIERLLFTKANLDLKLLVAYGVSFELAELIKVSSFITWS